MERTRQMELQNLVMREAEQRELPCNGCQLRRSNICGNVLGGSTVDMEAACRELKQTFRTASRRRNIYQAGAKADGVMVICSGWGFRFLQLPDGRRQILSFLVPGDMVSPLSAFADKFGYSVQALTDVRYAVFSRQELKMRLLSEPDVFNRFVKICVTEQERSDSAIADLGCRSATERVARLVLQLRNRLEERGLLDGNSFEFPLRQQQLADALGLTTVHVSRVIGKLREAGLMEIEQGRLTIMNIAELRQLGDMK